MHYEPADSAQDDPRSRSLRLARALEQNLRELIELRAKVRKAEEELAIRKARPSRDITTRRARK